MNDPTEPAAQSDSASQDTDATAPRRKGWKRVGNVLVIGWLAFVVGGLFYTWNILDPVMGPPVQNLVTYSMLLVTFFVLLFWLVALSPLPRKVALPLATLFFILPGAALAASIDSIHWTGDMQAVIHFRWEPTLEERLAAYRSEKPAHGDSPLTVEPLFQPTPEDMLNFRGAARDGVVVGPALAENWDDHTQRELWRRPCGEGYSSFAVLGDSLVTIEQRDDREAVVCYDALTGTERWLHDWPGRFEEAMGGPGPRSTPTISGENVYALGALGDLYCLQLADGSPVWNVNILRDNGLVRRTSADDLINTEWAMTSSPLMVDDLVVVNAGGPQGNGLVAYDAESGERVWQGEGLRSPAISELSKNRASYSSPMLVEIAGVRQIVIFDGVGLRGCDPGTGDQLWFYQLDEAGGDPGVINVAQPLLFEEDRIFITASYGRGSAMLQIENTEDGWAVSKLWDSRFLRSKFTSPVTHGGYIYGLDEGIMVCLDVETGERMWKRGRYGHGQMLLTGDRIFLLSERGEIVLIEPSPEGLQELTRQEVLPGAKTWNPPALVRGKAYVRNHLEMAAFNLCADGIDP